ncbi:putative aimless RasGEF [Drechmeria coniospora]|uniref:Putative aimless RasGEF n=1 Tax=Drechmeria coniospora TaxID=98403 RepID=A0A151GVY9_DRECN|nr:putative aimless RasGEF [Drechmeria coniospora]KYK61264.1 putative aimless RasGEF [Drechmeria coniospora]
MAARSALARKAAFKAPNSSAYKPCLPPDIPIPSTPEPLKPAHGSDRPRSSEIESISLDPQSAVAFSSTLQLPDLTSTNNRDSFNSIVDDPFFQGFDPPLVENPVVKVSVESSSADQPDDSDDASNSQRWPPSHRESLTIGPSQHWSHSQPSMESFNIAVIGNSDVGKSTFIQRVLSLPRPPISSASSVRMVVDNTTHMITLLELDLDFFESSSTESIQWPKQINGHIVPRIDAALILYDVMNQDSIIELPRIVAALYNSDLAAILVACKCDNPEDDWEVDADALANHEFFDSCLDNYKVSVETPDVSRECLLNVLRTAVANRRGRTSHVAKKRAIVDQPGASRSRRRPIPEPRQQTQAREFGILNFSWISQHGSVGTVPQADVEESDAGRIPKPASESDGESRRHSDDIPILQRGDDSVLEKQPNMPGCSLDELVDRLLALRLSKADSNFSDVFLCLYRKFAAPGELFAAIIVRLDRVRDDKSAHYLTKTATQLRIIEVVAKWVSLYPGDFARPKTRQNLDDFITHLSTEPVFSVAAQQMRRNLQFNVNVDDDTGWAISDDADDEITSKILSKDMSELSADMSTLQIDEANRRPSNSTEASAHSRGSVGSMSGPSRFSSYEDYDREAALLEPTDHLPMNKNRFHIFMDIPDDDIADELTRIDWIMFSSIRIRDFVRHVSLSAAQKGKCNSLRNVNRMISHFNHIANWVANMILLRDKAKHRAQMLEKFMNIALKLRQLNNYNGLAAILAGLNGSAIHRLAQTRSLVSIDVQKRFARTQLLMGTQKSHFAYRLAWENSPLPRIPFMPLHRRDLVSAEEGSKTFVGPDGDRINWRKFEVLGEVLLPMMKSQGTAYPNLVKLDTARDLILGCRMPTDEEEIYQRSLSLESSSGVVDGGKKKFPWSAK